MKQKNPVYDGSATTVQQSQPRHITPSLPPDGGRDNNGSLADDSAPEFIACIMIFKVKRNSGTNINDPFSPDQLPTFFGNSPPN
jgi:hypothetical protein